MSFQRVCAVAEVPSDEAIKVSIAGLDLAITRQGDEFFAIADQCSHAAVSLSDGEVADCAIECWMHGSKFDLRTGKPLGLPATESVAVYPTQISGEDVLVNIEMSN